MSLEEQLPVANWPIESGSYKVVQLVLDGGLLLRFGKRFQGHVSILMDLLDDVDIEYDEIKSARGKDAPALQGERYEVQGMGESYVDVEERRALFRGRSGDYHDYGMKIDAEHLDSVRPLVSDWTLGIESITV